MFKRILDSSLGYSSSNKKGAYNLRDYGPGTGTGPGSKYGRSVVTTQIGTRNSKGAHDLDNASEESILSGQNITPHAITKTTVVVVDRSESDVRTARSTWSKKSDIDPEHLVEDRI